VNLPAVRRPIPQSPPRSSLQLLGSCRHPCLATCGFAHDVGALQRFDRASDSRNCTLGDGQKRYLEAGQNANDCLMENSDDSRKDEGCSVDWYLVQELNETYRNSSSSPKLMIRADARLAGPRWGSGYVFSRLCLCMGLTISRSIIEAHGGPLWAKANGPRGAVFRFTLPITSES
jgi:hypothetical protein